MLQHIRKSQLLAKQLQAELIDCLVVGLWKILCICGGFSMLNSNEVGFYCFNCESNWMFDWIQMGGELNLLLIPIR